MEGDDVTLGPWRVEVRADAEHLKRELRAASDLGRSFASTIVDAFKDVGKEGKSLGDTLRGLALQLSKLVLDKAFEPLKQGLGSVFSSLFSSGFGAASGALQTFVQPTPFAKGGVIKSPIGFPLSRGGLGVAGEQGAEAIMPLARGPDGRLGVVSQGGDREVKVTFNVSSPDAQSFLRSESQVAAMLARAVTLGQRNL